MLEWLEVRLDVGDDKRFMYKCRIEALNSDGDVLKQLECCVSRASPVAAFNRRPTISLLSIIACSSFSPPTLLRSTKYQNVS